MNFRILVNGWNSPDFRSIFGTNVRRTYLKQRNYNILTVDWASDNATNSTRIVDIAGATGVVAGIFIEFLCQFGGINIKDVIVMGQSMGTYVASMIGKYLKGQLPVLYLFDPCRPFYNGFVITSDDAQYVEVIHTSCYRVGIEEPIGDADFYVNNCKTQKGCFLDFFGSCAHQRAHLYFSESLNSNLQPFWAVKCKDFDEFKKNKKCFSKEYIVKMGGDPPEYKKHGIFWLETNNKPPFAKFIGNQPNITNLSPN